MTLPAAVASLLAAGAVASCGAGDRSGGDRVALDVPQRAGTAAEELLSVMPAGADALLEIDLARLRANATVGPLLRAVAGAGELDLGFDIVRSADLVVVASYDIGDATAAKLTIVRGPGVNDIAGARPLGDDTVVLAPPQLAARMDEVRAGAQPALAQSRALLRARAIAMPDKADGAAIRAAAVLDFDARVALARELDLDAVPRVLSVWGDVADDLAVVAHLDGDDPGEGRRLARAIERVRDRMADSDAASRLVVGYVVRGAQVTARGASARAVLVVGPARLARIVNRLLRKLERSPRDEVDS
jgi:hypothetical protein